MTQPWLLAVPVFIAYIAGGLWVIGVTFALGRISMYLKWLEERMDRQERK